jgi:hypothetical protein
VSLTHDSRLVSKTVEDLDTRGTDVHATGAEAVVPAVERVTAAVRDVLSKVTENTVQSVAALAKDHEDLAEALSTAQAARAATVAAVDRRTQDISAQATSVAQACAASRRALLSSLDAVGTDFSAAYEAFSQGETEAARVECLEVSSRCKTVDERSRGWAIFVDTCVRDTATQFETDAVVVEAHKQHGVAVCGTLDTELREFCERTLEMNDAVPAAPACGEVRVSRHVTRTPADAVVLSTVRRGECVAAPEPAAAVTTTATTYDTTPRKHSTKVGHTRPMSTPEAAAAKENTGNSPNTLESPRPGKKFGGSGKKKRPTSAEEALLKGKTTDSPTAVGTPGRRGEPCKRIAPFSLVV